MSSSYQLHSWFTYSMLLLFLSTAGFWVKAVKLLKFLVVCCAVETIKLLKFKCFSCACVADDKIE